MKALKNLFLMLIAILCMSLISCKKDEPEGPSVFENSYVVGYWSLCEDAPYRAKSLARYYHFTSDGKMEFFYDEGTRKFYYTGTFDVKDNWLSISFQNARCFGKGEEGTCFEAEVKKDKLTIQDDRFLIDSIVGNDIRLKLNNHIFYLMKLDTWPDNMKAEYAEPEKAVNASNLPAQWDLRSMFILDGMKAKSVNITSPSDAGITLKEDGAVGPCRFWANQVWDKENKAGRVASDETITISYNDCSWELKGNKLTMRCASYVRITYNLSGDITSQVRITPDTPIEIEYEVYTFTEHWMILYALRNNTYYSFHRAVATPSSAPKKAGVSTSRKEEVSFNSNQFIQ